MSASVDGCAWEKEERTASPLSGEGIRRRKREGYSAELLCNVDIGALPVGRTNVVVARARVCVRGRVQRPRLTKKVMSIPMAIPIKMGIVK